MKYVFEVIPDYVGPGSNWPVTKLADVASIPVPLLRNIKITCSVCHTRLLSAIWDEHFPDVTARGPKYLKAVDHLDWPTLLNPTPENREKVAKYVA